MKTTSTTRPLRRATGNRRGAVAVEFAVVAPVLVAIVLGMVELNRVFETQNTLEVAAREGARFAAMDRGGMQYSGSTNTKLIGDVKNFLASNGIDREDIVVEVKDAENPTSDFDLDDPANDLKLFEVQVSVNYSEVSLISVPEEQDYMLTGKITFRNGVATIAE